MTPQTVKALQPHGGNCRLVHSGRSKDKVTVVFDRDSEDDTLSCSCTGQALLRFNGDVCLCVCVSVSHCIYYVLLCVCEHIQAPRNTASNACCPGACVSFVLRRAG